MEAIRIRGARTHNLKNLNLDLPRNRLTVITGLSGSGKSSLACGTLYAEAQRRYLESVAPYARRVIPRDGQSRRSYHVAGRAVDINQEPFQSADNSTVIVREDIGRVTYWRVFIKAKNQDGSMGEPLREAPWSLQVGTAEGGKPLDKIPPGYYVDFTTLATDYGWERVRAIWRWRSYYPDVEWWHFQKTDGLPWWDAMEQVYKEEDIIKSYGPYPGYD